MTALSIHAEVGRLNGLEGAALISEALETFGDRVALVSSFGAESAVLLHMASIINSEIPVIFIDTGKLFAHTYEYKRELITFLGLSNVRTMNPDLVEVDDEDPMSRLWRENTNHCCNLRKVRPLERALDGYTIWISGRKKFQTNDRAHAQNAEIQDERIVLSPLLHWSPSDLGMYLDTHSLPRHPLENLGYSSIGCFTCTVDVEGGGDPRSGRWPGQTKNECGIHRASLKSVA